MCSLEQKCNSVLLDDWADNTLSLCEKVGIKVTHFFKSFFSTKLQVGRKLKESPTHYLQFTRSQKLIENFFLQQLLGFFSKNS